MSNYDFYDRVNDIDIYTRGEYSMLVYDNGREEYYKNGILHRDEDLPAIIEKRENYKVYLSDHKRYKYFLRFGTNIECIWFKNGLMHRENDRPAMITFTGNCMWKYEGKLYKTKCFERSIYIRKSSNLQIIWIDYWNFTVIDKEGNIIAKMIL